MQAHSPTALKRVSTLNYFSGFTPPSLALEPGDLRVLIVNEDMRSAKSLKAALHDLGYLCTFTAYSARRALELADELAPAVAFLANHGHFGGSAVLEDIKEGNDAVRWKVDLPKLGSDF